MLFGVLLCLVVSLFFVTSCSTFRISALAMSQKEEVEPPTDRPNIIFVLADDLDFASVQKMPKIRSRLIEEGISFSKAFVSYSTCCPSRATILTGLYAHHNDVRGNEPPEGGFQKFLYEGLEEDTIAVSLQEAGYQTAFFGKYLNGYPAADDQNYVPPGWEEWYGKLGGPKPYDYKINENGKGLSYGSDTEDFYTDVLSGQATGFVRRAAPDSRPFFAYVAPNPPHEPATPAERHQGAFAEEEAPRPPSFDEEDVSDKPSWIRNRERMSEEGASDIDDYYRQRLESMLAVDEMVASLVDELEAAGELENTYIFFTSDNGWHQGEHRIEEGKDYPYEESARVPLFVRGPGVPAGSTVEELVLNTDFAPTFAEIGDAEFPETDGRSLMPLLGDEAPPSWRSAILLERLVGKPHFVYSAIRTETHKYIEYSTGENELYDLEADPYELESIHESADPSLVQDLKARLDELRSCTGEGCREAELSRVSLIQRFFDLFKKP